MLVGRVEMGMGMGMACSEWCVGNMKRDTLFKASKVP